MVAKDVDVAVKLEKNHRPAGEESHDTKPQPSMTSTTRKFRCLYCRGTQGRCSTIAASSTRSITECCSCARVVEERHSQSHQIFPIRAQDTPLPFVTPDLNTDSTSTPLSSDNDPFHPTGFITTFSTWSLDPFPVFAKTSFSFAGHLAELERVLGTGAAEVTGDGDVGPNVSVDRLRAYVQILDVSSILVLDQDIADHSFRLFKDCSLTTCLRNRNVEALATAALVQAIREAQEPRTLQEISSAANLPQKEIGKYIKILGEALKLWQPINSNSISVHMPRFCMLLQLNKSAQELAGHIGEVVINKCFCTRRNPISISAAAIYLACQFEDKRKTQAEICKVTGLTEITLRKVYKELLENWDHLLPPNYIPAVPPEKAFPMTTIPSSRSSICKTVLVDNFSVKAQQEKEKQKKQQQLEVVKNHTLWQTQVRAGGHHVIQFDAKKNKGDQMCTMINQSEARIDSSRNNSSSSQRTNQFSAPSGLSNGWPFQTRPHCQSPSTSSTHIRHLGQRNDSSLNQGAAAAFRGKTNHFISRND